MSGTRTVDMTHKLPPSFVAAWRARYLQQCRRTSGSILQPAGQRLTTEQERTLRFGPAWCWMGLKPADRQFFWDEDERQSHQTRG